MLRAMRDASPAAASIDTVVNTHANGDHCYGNQLVADATIVTSEATARELAAVPPATMQALLDNAAELGAAGAFFRDVFGPFDFKGIELPPVSRTFSGELSLRVGGKTVHLIEVGPAHTKGDVLVHVPAEGVLFTGDILFIEGTPILWEGPVGNWIRACDRIEELGADVLVPGHGPVTDPSGARAVRDYLVFVRDEARARFEAGLSVEAAALDIELGPYQDWRDSERIAVNVATLYREFGAAPEGTGALELFGLMAKLARR
jgi:glyoxylase-like metal-dependent hydrolase (beta-lactamase superfamily II)